MNWAALGVVVAVALAAVAGTWKLSSAIVANTLGLRELTRVVRLIDRRLTLVEGRAHQAATQAGTAATAATAAAEAAQGVVDAITPPNGPDT